MAAGDGQMGLQRSLDMFPRKRMPGLAMKCRDLRHERKLEILRSHADQQIEIGGNELWGIQPHTCKYATRKKHALDHQRAVLLQQSLPERVARK